MRDGEPTDGDKERIDGESPAGPSLSNDASASYRLHRRLHTSLMRPNGATFPEGFPLSEDLLEEGVEGTVAPAADLSVDRELRRLSGDLTAVLVAGRLPNS